MRISLGTVAKITLLSGAALCAQPNPSLAQTSSVIALPDGRTVEIIGLRRWTVAMLQDSLARYAPSDSLQSHACAAVLRYTLHFADASSTTFQFGRGTPDAIIVSVREPQDSARVHYRNMPLDTLPGRKAWRQVADVARLHPNVFWPEVQKRLKLSYGRNPQYGNHQDSVLAKRFALALDSFHRPADLREATKALATDPKLYDRVAAALILTNFAGRDEVWWSLVDAIRERDGAVKGLAEMILVGLSRSAPRTVNWAPKADGIHAMLDGTSLFQLDDLMQVLATTPHSRFALPTWPRRSALRTKNSTTWIPAMTDAELLSAAIKTTNLSVRQFRDGGPHSRSSHRVALALRRESVAGGRACALRSVGQSRRDGVKHD